MYRFKDVVVKLKKESCSCFNSNNEKYFYFDTFLNALINN